MSAGSTAHDLRPRAPGRGAGRRRPPGLRLAAPRAPSGRSRPGRRRRRPPATQKIASASDRTHTMPSTRRCAGPEPAGRRGQGQGRDDWGRNAAKARPGSRRLQAAGPPTATACGATGCAAGPSPRRGAAGYRSRHVTNSLAKGLHPTAASRASSASGAPSRCSSARPSAPASSARPAGIADKLPGPLPLLAVWVTGGLFALCGALTLAEMRRRAAADGRALRLHPRRLGAAAGLPLRMGASWSSSAPPRWGPSRSPSPSTCCACWATIRRARRTATGRTGSPRRPSC